MWCPSVCGVLEFRRPSVSCVLKKRRPSVSEPTTLVQSSECGHQIKGTGAV